MQGFLSIENIVEPMIKYLLIIIICAMNITFCNSRIVSIRSRLHNFYLGCKRTIKRGGTLGRVRTGYNYEVEDYSTDGSDETHWDVVDIDDNNIALKNKLTNRYLSVQPGIL